MKRVAIIIGICFGLSIGVFAQDTIGVANLLHEAEVLLDSADYEKALQKSQLAVEKVACAYGVADPAYAAAIITSGKALLDLDRYPEMIGLLNQSLAILQPLPPAIPLADALNLLGQYHYYTGNLAEAFNRHQQALTLRQQLPGATQLDVADSYNNLGNLFYRAGNYPQASQYHQSALAIRKQELGASHPETASSHNNLGACLRVIGEYQSAILNYEKALKIRREVFGSNHPKTAQSYNNLANAHYDKGAYDLAIRNHQEALAIRQNRGLHLPAAQSLNNLANVYKVKNRPREALALYQKTLGIRDTVLGPGHPLTGRALFNLGDTYNDLGDFQRATNLLSRALIIYREQLPPGHPETGYVLDALGRSYKATNKVDRALPLFQEAFRIFQQALGNQHPMTAKSLNNLANSFFQQMEYGQALDYYEQSLELLREAYPPGHPFFALTFNNIGNCHLELGEINQAEEKFQNAIRLLAGKEKDYLATTLGTLNSLANTAILQETPQKALAFANQAITFSGYADRAPDAAAPLELLPVLLTKGRSLQALFDKEMVDSFLVQAHQNYQEAIHLMDTLRTSFREDGSKQSLLANNYRLYEAAIENALRLADAKGDPQYRNQSFIWSEESKALLLREATQRTTANQFSDIPESLRQRETQLKADILALEKKRFETAAQLPADQRRALENDLLLMRQAYNDLIDTFSVAYPNYFKLRYDNEVVSVTEVQQSILDADQGLVAYFVGDKNLFIFLVTPDTLATWSFPTGSQLVQSVAQLRTAISRFPGATASGTYEQVIDLYADAGYQLYTNLFEPLTSVDLPQKLILIPEGALSYLPFSTLLSQPVPDNERRFFHRYPYLLKDYQLSYSYSATLLFNQKQEGKAQPSGSFVGFAPSFEGTALAPLKYNQVEVEKIGSLTGGKTFIGEEAQLNTFLEKANQFNILHLATHGEANDSLGDYAYLAFVKNDSLQLLYAADLYPLQLEAELVVLSACKTGIGEYRRGEGIVSLARGFLFAGAHSILTTLWSIDDQKSADLMADFYDLLKSGKNKAEALQSAKRQFLAKHRQDEAHPFYWSPYIAHGDIRPISLKNNSFIPWITAAIILLLAFTFWVIRINFKKRRKKGEEFPF